MESNDAWEDVLGNGDLMRKVTLRGCGERPSKGDIITIKLDGEILPKFILGYGFAIDALEITIPLMSCGEICLIKSVPRFCENQGNIQEFQVSLENIEPPDCMEDIDKISVAKIRGNELYEHGEYEKALILYNYGLQLIQKDRISVHMETYATFISNICAALLKANNYKEIIRLTDLFIAQDSSTVNSKIIWKILIRRAESFIGMKEFFSAEQTLLNGLTKFPENKYATLLAANVAIRRKKEDQRLRNTYKHMIKNIREDGNRKYITRTSVKFLVVALLIVFTSYVISMMVQKYY